MFCGPIGAASGLPLVRGGPGWTDGGPSGGVAPEAPAVSGHHSPCGRILPPQKKDDGQPVQAWDCHCVSCAVILRRLLFGSRLSPTDRALLVADQFAVTFDGHLRELPDSCALLLAQDVSADSSFTLLLNADPQSYILIGLNNDTVSIQKNGQVLLHASWLCLSPRRKQGICLSGEGQLQWHCVAQLSRQQRPGCQSQIKHHAAVQSEWSVFVMWPAA